MAAANNDVWCGVGGAGGGVRLNRGLTAATLPLVTRATTVSLSGAGDRAPRTHTLHSVTQCDMVRLGVT